MKYWYLAKIKWLICDENLLKTILFCKWMNYKTKKVKINTLESFNLIVKYTSRPIP
jgi:hypothetical protein